jgi:hypothetical protein
MPTITSWDDPACPIPVDYSREAFGEIRRAALDGFLALPRVGIGVGGLLLGRRENSRTVILDSVPIECSHADGPAFTLTLEETAGALELAAAAAPLLVVGWYCSKTRGTVALSERDLILYEQLCPEAWQVALLVRPRTVEPSRAALCFRVAEGLVVRGVDRVLQPCDPDPAEEPVLPEEPGLPEEPIAPAPPAEIQPPPFAAFAPPPRPSPLRRVAWVLAAAALVTAAGAGFVTRNDWMPRPPLRLTASDSGGQLTIRWNADSLPGIDHASLLLDDGGQPQSIQLDGAQLRSGRYQFERKSSHVTATLKAGAAQALTTFPATSQ